VRISIRVYPSAKRSTVGGRYGSTEPPVLIVRVAAPAADGKANEAVVEAVAAAFHIPLRNARIVSGVASRTKVLELDGADPQVLAALLATSPEG
jgi:uncharacterized protein YggU (UPF0235/DUF167 family)